MTLKIKLNLDNAAFKEGGTEEVQRILDDLCTRLPKPLTKTNGEYLLYDSNGNYIGRAKITNE